MDMDTSELINARAELARIRLSLDVYSEAVRAAQDRVDETDAYKTLLTVKQMKSNLEQAEVDAKSRLASLVVAAFDGQNKKVIPGASITEVRSVEYDAASVLRWAVSHATDLVNLPSLNARKFESEYKKGAHQSAPASIKISLAARIDSDLSEYANPDHGQAGFLSSGNADDTLF